MGEGRHQIALIGEVAAADGIEIVVVGRIAFLGRALDAALGHDGVGVAVAQLGGDDDLAAALRRHDRSRGAGPAAAEDQDVGVEIDLARD